MSPAKSTSARKEFTMFRQKSTQKLGAAIALLLALLAFAPAAFADDGLFDGLLRQLAVFLGLADEAGPCPSPGGLAQPANEAGEGYSPGGFSGGQDRNIASNEAGEGYSPGG